MTTVTAEDVDPATAARLAAMWATLPHTFRPTSAGAQLLALGGRSPDWPERLATAASRGVDGIVLVDPAPVPSKAVRELAATVPVPLVIQTNWAGNPAVGAFRDRVAADLAGTATVRLLARHALDRGSEQTLLDEFILVRAAVGPITGTRFARFGEHGHTVVAEARGRLVHLQGVSTAVDAGRARLAALGTDREHSLELPPAGTVAPAHAVLAGPDGALALPPIHEDGARATWRAAHRLIGTSEHGDALHSLAADLDQLAAAAALSTGS